MQSPQLPAERNESIFEYSAQFNNTGAHRAPQASGSPQPIHHYFTSKPLNTESSFRVFQGCLARVLCASRGKLPTERVFLKRCTIT